MPMTIHNYDFVPLALRAMAIAIGVIEETTSTRVHYQRDNAEGQENFLDLAFQAILLRFTGRIGRFHVYWKQRKLQEATIMPQRKDLETFLDFVRCTLSGGTSLGSWISKQHEGQIPKQVKQYSAFENFLREVCKKLGKVMEESTAMKYRGQRLHAVKRIAELLWTAVEKDDTPTEMQRSKYAFLSSQVLMDLEEIYMDPFGAVDSSSVFPGDGGRDGLRMLKLPGTSTGSRSLTHVRLGFTVSTELRVLRTRYWMTPPYVRHRWFTFYSPRAYRVYRPWDYML
jgi:hypothetical protein